MRHHVYQYEKGKFSHRNIPVVREVPFRILVAGEELATLMCTPVKLRELALGFLAFEHQIDSYADVEEIEVKYLYRQGDTFVFMDKKTYEQYELSAEQVDDNWKYLKEGLDCSSLWI